MVRLKAGLQDLYGPRLRGVYLFGSYARGHEDPESDLDLLVVLDRVDRYWDEIVRTGELASAISLEFGVTVSLVFAGENDWRTGASSFLRNVREEAVAA